MSSPHAATQPPRSNEDPTQPKIKTTLAIALRLTVSLSYSRLIMSISQRRKGKAQDLSSKPKGRREKVSTLLKATQEASSRKKCK